MNRRYFILGILGAAASGAALSSAQAAPANTLWDDLQGLDAAAPAEDLPAEGASEAQNRRARGRGYYRGRRAYGRRYWRPRRRAYGRYWGPRRRRRVCRVVRNRRGFLVRRCWRRW